ncbi:MAG TPA: DUF3024 domain-containing protein [Candidatus Binatia bacterium]|jgi:hypothetical protein
MALSEFEHKRCDRIVAAFIAKRRPSPELRAQVDLGFRVANQSVEIFEIRPRWNNPEVTHEIAVAKATYVKAQRVWRVYWQRRDLKWHPYDPMPEVDCLEAFLQLVHEDEYACFWG